MGPAVEEDAVSTTTQSSPHWLRPEDCRLEDLLTADGHAGRLLGAGDFPSGRR